jgi:NAD(P)-dependent dehydrogenase (short-subunit alcohol dehydrogenase family)
MKTRTAFVTGANRGVGLAVVKELATDETLKVLLGCRNLEEGRALAGSIKGHVEAVEMNLSSQDSISQATARLVEAHGPVDILVNNAGVLNQGSILEDAMEDIAQSFQVNTMAPIQLTKSFLPSMIQKGFGRVVNVSSGWGSFEDGLEGPFSYSVTKAALNAVTLATARGLPSDVKVNSACPGWVRTRMGGMMASRSVEQGADTLVWLATLPSDGPSGGFFRDRKLIEW